MTRQSMRFTLLSLLGLAASSAHADNLRLPAERPPAWQAECGSCHVAFPPGLLPAADWQRIMGTLDRHYGVDASLDAPTGKRITEFLVRHAGSANYSRGDTAPKPGAVTAPLPRLTLTPWFQREHREVPAALWRDPRVKSAANCAACHTQAAQGDYRERNIRIPR